MIRCSATASTSLNLGTREFVKAQRAHEEGVIAKRAAGLYYSGKRTREWLKCKAVYEQEIVIVGYTRPRRSRKYFGSLALAVRDKTNKRWVLCGACRDRLQRDDAKITLRKDACLEDWQKAFRPKG